MPMIVNIDESIFTELADFLVSQPTLEQLVAYRVSEAADKRMGDLLEKNREAGLTPDEREEMTSALAVSRLMKLVKAKAQLKLREQS